MEKVSNDFSDDLLIAYITGSVSENEKVKVIKWLEQSIDNKRYYDQIMDLYLLGQVIIKPTGFNPQQSLARIKAKYYQTRYHETNKIAATSAKNYKIKLVLSIAATVLITFGLSFIFNLFSPSGKSTYSNAYNEIITPKGARTSLILPDGTKVWLNAGSKIRYPMDFLEGHRRVTLVGEAYFDVAKKRGQKFIVQTSLIEITVWGTKFNVKDYPDDKTINTTLVEGSISITKLSGGKNEKPTYLKPNQTAIYNKVLGSKTGEKINDSAHLENRKPTSVHIKKTLNTLLYTSWKDEKWIIEGESLGNLAIELERRYNVLISFENEAIKGYKFNGIFTKESLEQILNIIKISAPIDYQVLNGRVDIKENKAVKYKYDNYLNSK